MNKNVKQRVLSKGEITESIIDIIGVVTGVPQTEYNKARRANNNAPLHLAYAKGELSVNDLLQMLQVYVRYMKFENEALDREQKYFQQLINDLMEEEQNE